MNENDVLIFEAEDVNNPAWEKVIKVLRANIPGFKVYYCDGNYMNFLVPSEQKETPV